MTVKLFLIGGTLEQKKQQIVDHAKTLFLSKGFNATTIQNIADACGVAKGSVYLQFASKKDIFFAIVIETDEQVWRQVKRVQGEPLSPREKLIQILGVYFKFIHENRRLSELLIHEVGLELSHEMLAQTEAMRFRWQNSIDDSVKEVLGPKYEKWKSDLGFTVTGLMECFHGFLLIGNVQIDEQAITNYLLLLIDTMGPALAKADFEPMISPDALQPRADLLADLEKQKKLEIDQTLQSISQCLKEVFSDGLMPPSQKKLFQEGFEILSSECRSETPRKAIVQGMLAGLRGISEISSGRRKLAELIGVQLV